MHYWEMPDHARGLCDRALELLREYKTPPTPPAYEIWFNYAAGLNQDLVRTIDAAVADGRIRDNSFLRETYSRYFGDGSSELLDQLGEKLQHEVQKFAKVLEDAGEDTTAYGKTLNEAASHLSGGDVGQLKVLITGVVAATRAMEAKQKDMESNLKASAQEVATMRARMETVRKESLMDALTGLANRRCFDERMEEAIREVRVEGGEFCVLLGDVDHFKKFNDTWGHATGDQVLRLVGQCFKANTKGRDTAARYGGEEFSVLLPQTSVENAITLAEQIRKAVESKKIVKRSTGETLGSITLSLGVARYKPGEPAEEVLNRADQCLYAAKRAGRNRVMSEWTVDATEVATAAAQ